MATREEIKSEVEKVPEERLDELYRDLLVCGVSTQLRQQVKDFDEVISPSDADFASSGLLTESLIRLGFLAVLPRKSIVGSIGEISKERHERLLQTLSKYLIANVS